jgi:hypothetical protein
MNQLSFIATNLLNSVTGSTTSVTSSLTGSTTSSLTGSASSVTSSLTDSVSSATSGVSSITSQVTNNLNSALGTNTNIDVLQPWPIVSSVNDSSPKTYFAMQIVFIVVLGLCLVGYILLFIFYQDNNDVDGKREKWFLIFFFLNNSLILLSIVTYLHYRLYTIIDNEEKLTNFCNTQVTSMNNELKTTLDARVALLKKIAEVVEINQKNAILENKIDIAADLQKKVKDFNDYIQTNATYIVNKIQNKIFFDKITNIESLMSSLDISKIPIESSITSLNNNLNQLVAFINECYLNINEDYQIQLSTLLELQQYYHVDLIEIYRTLKLLENLKTHSINFMKNFGHKQTILMDFFYDNSLNNNYLLDENIVLQVQGNNVQILLQNRMIVNINPGQISYTQTLTQNDSKFSPSSLTSSIANFFTTSQNSKVFTFCLLYNQGDEIKLSNLENIKFTCIIQSINKAFLIEFINYKPNRIAIIEKDFKNRFVFKQFIKNGNVFYFDFFQYINNSSFSSSIFNLMFKIQNDQLNIFNLDQFIMKSNLQYSIVFFKSSSLKVLVNNGLTVFTRENSRNLIACLDTLINDDIKQLI